MKSIAFILTVAASGAYGQQAPNPQSAAPTQPTSFDCAIDGSVVNALTGEPIVRAHVGLQGMQNAIAGTDSSGKWNLSGVACRAAQIVVTRPGFLAQNRRIGALVPGSPLHDVKLELTPQSVLYGKVVDDQGDPMALIGVHVLSSRVVDGQIRFEQASEAPTNDLGEYRIAGLRRGRYIVCATTVDLPVQPGGLVPAGTCYPGPVEAGSANALDVGAGREAKVDFALTLVPSVHVRGTVSGLPEGRGVGINLMPRGASSSVSNNVSPRANTFDFRAPAGAYVLRADYFDSGRHLFARVPVDVGTSDVDNVAVVMETGLTIPGTVRVDSGTQRADPRQPFILALRASDPAGVSMEAKWGSDRSTFSFIDAIPGSYRLYVSPPAPWYVKSAALAGHDILSGDFTVSQAAAPIEIVIANDGGSIEGDVVNADGQPVSGGVLALRNGRAMVTESNVHFKLTGLAPGDYKVWAWDDASEVPWADAEWMRRYAGSGADVTVASGQSSQVKLTEQNVPQ